MVIEVNYDSAESTINSLKCDELKALLSIDQLPRSGRKDELRQRCLAHVRSSLRSEQFLNAIKAAAAAQSNQVLNQTKIGKKLSTSSLSATMSCLNIGRRVENYSNERSSSNGAREISVQTQTTPVKKTMVGVYTQTELARSPNADETKSMPSGGRGSCSLSNSSCCSSLSSESFDFEPEPSLLAEIHRHDIYSLATVVTSRIEFKWPESVPHSLVASQLLQVKIRFGMMQDGRFFEGIQPGNLIELTINGVQVSIADGDTFVDITSLVHKQQNAYNAIGFIMRPNFNPTIRKFMLYLVVVKTN